MKSPKFFGKLKSPNKVHIRRIVGTSMLPTLQHGQLVVFVSRRAREGDIVMINHDGREKIKRITQLKTSRVYVVGDNQQASTDSRHFGWLPADMVIARLIWPRR